MPPIGSKPDSYFNMMKSYHLGKGTGQRQQCNDTEKLYLRLGKRYNDIEDAQAFISYCAQRDDPK